MRISAILSLLSAGENRSFFIMPEIYNGVNESVFWFFMLLRRVFAFIVKGCYNEGTKG